MHQKLVKLQNFSKITYTSSNNICKLAQVEKTDYPFQTLRIMSNNASSYKHRQELEKIKSQLLDALIKIRFEKNNNTTRATILEYNEKAQKLLQITDNRSYNLIEQIKSTLSPDYNWDKTLTETCINEKDTHIEVENHNTGKYFHIRFISMSDNVCIMNIQDTTEICKNRKELKQTRELFEEFADSIPEIICDVDVNGNIIYANRKALKTFGFSKTDIETGLGIFEFFQEKDQAEIKRNFRKLVKGNKLPSYEYRLSPLGKSTHIMLNTTPIIISGQITGVRAVMADITKKDELQKQLRSSDTNFRNLFDSLSNYVFILDTEGNILHTNKTVLNRLGYTEKELYNKNIRDLHPREFNTNCSGILSNYKQNTIRHCNVPFVDKFNNKIAVDTSIIFGEWNEQKVLFVNSKDLTETEASEKKFSAAFHANPSLMAITTPDGYILDVNESFLKTIGYKKEEIIHRGIREFKMFDVNNLETIRQKIKNEGKVKNLETNLRTRSGQQLQCLFSAEIIKGVCFTSLLIVINDISEQYKLNRKIHFTMKTARLAWYEFDIVSGIVNAGSNKAEMLGYKRDMFENKHYSQWVKLIHPEDYRETVQAINNCMNGKTDLFQVDYRIKKHNGEYAWFLDRGIITEYTVNKKPKQMIGVVIDITDRKENEKRYQQLIESANDVIIITQKGKIKFANNKIINFFGYDKEDIIEKDFIDFISKEEQNRIIAYHQKRVQGENTAPIYETRILNKEGVEVPVELNNSTFVFNNEPAVLTFIRDLRRRKKTEAQLKQSLRNFDLATKNVRSIIWKTEINDAGEFTNTYISKVADKMLGYPEGSINHDLSRFMKHIHPDDYEESMKALQYGIQNPGIKIEYEYRIIKTDRTIAWCITQGSSEIEEDGKKFIFGVTMDISERKKIEMESLQQSEFLYRLLDNIPSMIAVKNDKGIFTNVNKHFANFYKLEPKDIIGKTDDDILPAEKATEMNNNNKHILEEGKNSHYNISEIFNGEKHYYDVTKVPLKNAENIYDQILIISNDITEQTLTRKEIQKKSRELLMLLENVDVQIWYIKDPETYGIMNKAHADFLGKPKEELEHKKIQKLFDKANHESYIKTNRQCFDTKQPIHFDEWNINAKKENRLLRITKNPMLNEKGEVDFVICLARDITEEKASEKRLSNTLHFNQLLIENSPIGIIVYRTDGQCILANQAAANIVGAISNEDMMKQNAYEIESWKKYRLTDLFDKAKNEKVKVHEKIKVTSTYGKQVWIECNFLQINYHGNKHVMLMVDDITEIKQQEISIQNNLERQKTLSKIAFQLSELKDFNHNINQTLKIIGEFMDVSRVYIFRNSRDNSYCFNEYEWCNQGIEPQIDFLSHVDYNDIKSWRTTLLSEGSIHADNINVLPQEIIRILSPQKIKSIIVFPMILFNKFGGFIGFDENREYRKWKNDDFEFLNTISHIIANTYERKIIGDTLRDSEEMFKKITGSAQDGIILLNSKGLTEYWNPSAEAIFGYKRADILNKNMHRLLAKPEDYTKFTEKQSFFSKTGQGDAIGKNIEMQAKHKSGKIIDIELSLSSLKIKGEWHSLGIVRDITERKKSEDQLKTLSKAVEYASASIVITDIEGNIEYVNKKFLDSTGYTAEEVLGENPRILSSGDYPKEFYTELWETITQGKEWKGEFHNKRKDGSTYYESALISSVSDDEGNIIHFIGIKEDITKEKQDQTELIEAKRNAEMANKAKSEFLANMSHEIRTPMNAVIGFSEILAQKIEDEEQLSYLNSIQASSQNLLNLINDILDLSKIEAGQLKIQPEQANIKSVIEDIAQVFSLKIQQKGLNYEVDIDPNIPDRLFTDELRLRQILLNLIGNAVKFTEDGYVKVITELLALNEDDTVDIKISIEDTGIGIKPGSQQEIFEAFHQQEDHNTRKYGGTGLGLSITKRLVEILGGHISMKSKVGLGSTFSVIFEKLEVPRTINKQEIYKEIAATGIDFNNELVLIVDDVPSNRFLLNSYLSEYKLRTVEAENGSEAIEICQAELPDIVLMDLRMPVMNGIDATIEIKSNNKTKHIPVIAVTATSMNFDDRDIEKSNFDGFLDKPVTQEEIIEELIKHLKPLETDIPVEKPNEIRKNNHDLDLTEAETEFVKKELCPRIEAVISSGNMNAINHFAENIHEAGNIHKSNALLTFSNELKTASQNFDIEKIQELFNMLRKYC